MGSKPCKDSQCTCRQKFVNILHDYDTWIDPLNAKYLTDYADEIHEHLIGPKSMTMQGLVENFFEQFPALINKNCEQYDELLKEQRIRYRLDNLYVDLATLCKTFRPSFTINRNRISDMDEWRDRKSKAMDFFDTELPNYIEKLETRVHELEKANRIGNAPNSSQQKNEKTIRELRDENSKLGRLKRDADAKAMDLESQIAEFAEENKKLQQTLSNMEKQGGCKRNAPNISQQKNEKTIRELRDESSKLKVKVMGLEDQISKYTKQNAQLAELLRQTLPSMKKQGCTRKSNKQTRKKLKDSARSLDTDPASTVPSATRDSASRLKRWQRDAHANEDSGLSLGIQEPQFPEVPRGAFDINARRQARWEENTMVAVFDKSLNRWCDGMTDKNWYDGYIRVRYKTSPWSGEYKEQKLRCGSKFVRLGPVHGVLCGQSDSDSS